MWRYFSRACAILLAFLTVASCTTYSAKEYDPSKHRYPPSRYMPPPQWSPNYGYYPYPQDMDNYYIYGTGQGYPIYNRNDDNPNYVIEKPSPHNSPSYDYPLYYQ